MSQVPPARARRYRDLTASRPRRPPQKPAPTGLTHQLTDIRAVPAVYRPVVAPGADPRGETPDNRHAVRGAPAASGRRGSGDARRGLRHRRRDTGPDRPRRHGGHRHRPRRARADAPARPRPPPDDNAVDVRGGPRPTGRPATGRRKSIWSSAMTTTPASIVAPTRASRPSPTRNEPPHSASSVRAPAGIVVSGRYRPDVGMRAPSAGRAAGEVEGSGVDVGLGPA